MATAGGADADALNRLEATALLAALRTLPDAHQEVIELRYLQDLNVAEVATILDIGEEAVRALTYRALKGLRRACEPLR